MIRLIWPPKELSPNSRKHWRVKADATVAYRVHAKSATRAAGITVPPEGKIELRLSFYPPNARKRDDDNCVSSFKAARDGIADALGIDDNRFVTVPTVCDPDPAKQGFVQVELHAWER
jgi:crossover junction endodeoxyribonuclease RusA